MTGDIVNNVLEGKDGWLFLFQGGQSQFDYLTGEKKIDNQSVENFINNIKTRTHFCQEHNIKYHHVVFPSKPVIKKEYLPIDYELKVNSLYQRYYEKENKEISNSIYYPINDLIEIEKNYSTFKKYNTHMTDRAYLEITKKLLAFVNVPFNDDLITYTKREIGGNLSNMLKKELKHEEELIHIDVKEFYEVGNRSFLLSNTNEVQINHTFGLQNQQRVLIFGDSFFKDIIKYLKPFFSDIIYIRSATMQYDIIELYKPDIIFTGNAERYLSLIESDCNASPFLWNLYGDHSYKPSKEYLDALSANLSYGHYHKFYNEWLERVKEESVLSLEFKRYQYNKDVKIIESEESLKFESLGKDPNFIFYNMNFQEERQYLLVISLVSSVNTIFQVFYSDKREQPYIFNEEKSIKRVVLKGTNTLNVLLDYKSLGTVLRIDPMNNPGIMNIVEMKIKVI